MADSAFICNYIFLLVADLLLEEVRPLLQNVYIEVHSSSFNNQASSSISSLPSVNSSRADQSSADCELPRADSEFIKGRSELQRSTDYLFSLHLVKVLHIGLEIGLIVKKLVAIIDIQ